MDKPVCSSLSEVATDDDLKVDQNQFADKAVNEKALVGFQGDQNNSMDDDNGLVSGAGGLLPPASVVFPEEVWEVILNQIANSEDIRNVLLAFPVLDNAFQSKKAFWLFGAVLPHLMTKHLETDNFKDVFTLRLVSKRWKWSVDSSLTSHVALQHLPQPPDADSKEYHQKLIPSENHFNYIRPQKSTFGASIFRTRQQIDDLLTVMSNRSGNPFPAKHVAVKVSISNIYSAVALFEKYGEHVEFLEIKLHGSPLQCHLELCRNVLLCLSHSPNLRSLTFTGNLHASADKQTCSFFSKLEANKLFPILLNLEASSWQVDFKRYYPQMSMWISRMIQKHERQEGIKKFGIGSDLYCKVASSFPSQTELTLIGENWDSTELVKNALASLANPLQLRKLCLVDVAWLYIKDSNLINYLAHFKIESLILEDLVLTEYEGMSEVEMMSSAATSITSLYLADDWNLSYDFFKWLPNLQFLTIYFKSIRDSGGQNYFFEEGIKPGDNLATRIRALVVKACDKDVEIKGIQDFSSVWDELPMLQMLSVWSVNWDTKKFNMQFVREWGDKAFISSKPEVGMLRPLQEDD